MSLTKSSKYSYLLLAIFYLSFAFLAESRLPLRSEKASPPSDGVHERVKPMGLFGTRGTFTKSQESQDPAEDQNDLNGEENEDVYRTQMRESQSTQQGGKGSEKNYKSIRTNEDMLKKTVITDPTKSTNVQHRSILQAKRENINHTRFILYDKSMSVSANESWSMEWDPNDEFFLMAYCQIGQLSNRVLCIMHALQFAAILNRTLLISMDPNTIIHHYDRHLIFDISYFRSCYGNKSIMTVEEYRKSYGKEVVIDQVVCVSKSSCKNNFSNFEANFLNWAPVRFSKSGLTFEIPTGDQMGVTEDELKTKVGKSPGKILFMGEFFYNRLVNESQYILPVKRSEECHSNVAVLPDHTILDLGNLFVKDVFRGKKYMAVHLRRGDFLSYCKGNTDCFPPIEQVAECLNEKIEVYGVKMVFLATNGSPEEVDYLMNNLSDNNKKRVHVVRLETELKKKRVRLPSSTKDRHVRSLWEAELDKIVCMLAPVFVGSILSTYTGDVERLRYAFQTANPQDTYLCEAPH